MRRALLAVVGLVAFGAMGCESKWERSFTALDGAPALTDTQAVRVREVSWERLEEALVELDAERSASDVAPEEWPEEKKAAAKQRLLQALQVSADPATVQVVGRSAFRTTYQTNPTSGELESLARRKGATTVVWSSNYLGKTQVVRDEPVTEWRSGSYYTSRGGRRRSDTFTENSTIWVPVVVEADEHAFMAYFLREPAGQ